MNEAERLTGKVKQGVNRLRKAERERRNLLAYTIYLGTLGLLVAVPVVGGAYLGVWLDERFGSYLFTLLCILAGVGIGAVNLYLYLRE
jgi:ATP synthase protein I